MADRRSRGRRRWRSRFRAGAPTSACPAIPTLAYRPRSKAPRRPTSWPAELRERIDGDLERGFTGPWAPPRRPRRSRVRGGSSAPTARRASSAWRFSRCCWPSATRWPRHRDAPPLLLLDDVMSELDRQRRRALVDLLRSTPGQSVITATDLDQVPGADDPGVVRLAVGDGRVLGRGDGGVKYRRSPRSMAAALDRAGRRSGARRRCSATSSGPGPAAVGPSIAAQAQPTAERGGVVTVSCAASVWAQELDLMAPQIITALERGAPGRVE